MSGNTPQDAVNITYDTTAILHITQFLIAGTSEEVVIDCSSGAIPDAKTGGVTIPVHARIALPWSAAQRLVQSLNRAIANQQQQQEASLPGARTERNASQPPVAVTPSAYATLPGFDTNA